MNLGNAEQPESERLEQEISAEEREHARARRAQARSELKQVVKKIVPEILSPDGQDRRDFTP